MINVESKSHSDKHLNVDLRNSSHTKSSVNHQFSTLNQTHTFGNDHSQHMIAGKSLNDLVEDRLKDNTDNHVNNLNTINSINDDASTKNNSNSDETIEIDSNTSYGSNNHTTREKLLSELVEINKEISDYEIDY